MEWFLFVKLCLDCVPIAAYIQAVKTPEERVGRLLDIIARRSNDHFSSFVAALVNEDNDDLATMLDDDIAAQFIEERNVSRGERERLGMDAQGIRLLLL